MARNIGDPTAVTNGDLCVGCGVCALAFPKKVSMSRGSNGFEEAHLTAGSELTPDESDQFRRFCPGLGYERPRRTGGPQSTAMWGNVIEAREAWASDRDVRRTGSSGGAITAIAGHLIASGKVEAVLGIAEGSEPLTNEMRVIRSVDACATLSGSRYSPATPFQHLGDLGTGARIAVVGKPCDIAGLRRFLTSHSEDGYPTVVVYLSFFCAGTPSWKGTREALSRLDVDGRELESLRYRGNGWPGKFSVQLRGGEERSMPYEKSWGQILNKHLHTRCKLCQDGMGSQADIVAADSWETDERGYPLFTESEGRSLLVSRTPVGEQIVQEALALDAISARPADIQSLGNVQPSQRTRREVGAARGLGYRLGGHSVPSWRGVPRWRWLARRPILSIRQFVGAFRRARRERRVSI